MNKQKLRLAVTLLGLSSLSIFPFFSHSSAAEDAAIRIDGSSTVFPITEGVVEEFQKANKNAKVTVGASGTGAGYKKFAAGEIDISDASRAIKPDEVQKCKENSIEFIELPVAYDGLTVAVNPKNTFVTSLTFEQLKKIWEPGSKVKTWKDVDATWPDQPIKLYGPSSEHGTFDYFTEAVVGKAKSSRSDYNAASDTNTLASGVAGDGNALGYFGYSYYAESKAKLKAVPISRDGKSPAVQVSRKSIEDGTYPLSRLLFITVNKKAADRAPVDAFVKFYLQNVKEIATSVGYTPLPQEIYEQVKQRYSARKAGAWEGASH